jgi:hypothetical protein
MHGSETSLSTSRFPARARWRSLPGLRWRPLLAFAIAAACGLFLLGGSSVPAGMTMWRKIDTISQAWDWDVVGWEIGNIGDKLRTQLVQPLRNVPADAQARLVRDYLKRAEEISWLEWELDQLYAEPAPGQPAASAAEQQQTAARLTVLREQQALVRPAVEQAIERQLAAVLSERAIGAGSPAFPPVWFTFTEPPRKLVASPRASIETAYYAMLQPNLPAEEREQIETAVLQEYDLSAYVTNIGGLGAFPAIVIDQAPLAWVLSTVAHEWVHNYLTLFPLGLNYAASPELTILNETVADIAGDELGAAVLAAAYPELVREFPGKDEPAPSASGGAEPAFDFVQEMRHTRAVVDQFLAAGRVEDAEEYMQIRRLLFQENGYPIRKLNQAYFAFHGAYGTSAAASSPIGPKLQQLRSLTPDLRTFLETVRRFTTEADLDAALVQWAKP